MEALRFDTGQLTKFEETPEGFLKVWMTVSKVGGLDYQRADGTIETEYLTAEELFKADSLRTAALKPISLLHPPEGLITPSNASKYQKGMTGHDAYVDGEFLTIVGCVTDAETIQAIKRGDASEVSAGYRCKVVRRDDGKLYQTDREYNHYAAVPRGRAGPDVRFQIDSADVKVSKPIVVNGVKPKMTRQITIDGQGYQIEDAGLADKIAKLLTDNADLQSKLTSETARADGLQGQLTAAQTKIDEATKAASTKLDADQVGSEVKARLDAWSEVLPWFRSQDASFQMDTALDVAGIQRTYLEKRTGQKLDGKSAEFVAGLYSGLKPEAKADTKADSATKLAEVLDIQDKTQKQSNNDGKGYEKMVAMRNAKSRGGKRMAEFMMEGDKAKA